MAYDPIDGYLVVFGGMGWSGYLNDTWELANGSWTDLTSSVGFAPSPREGASLTFDAADGYLLLLGGFGLVGNCSGDCNDLWSFVHGHWTHLPTPWSQGMRVLYNPWLVAAYDSSDGYVVALGAGTTAYRNQTWTDLTYNASCNCSRDFPRLEYATLVDDPAVQGLVLFGGWISTATLPRVTNETWVFSRGNWTNETLTVPSAPPPRFLGQGDYDEVAGSVVLFGGFTLQGQSYTTRQDTWSFANSAWANVTPAGSPPGLGWGAMAWDPGANRSIFFGGGNATEVPTNSTWTWEPWAPSATSNVTVREQGLPAGTLWWAALAGQNQSTLAGEWLNFSVTPGVYDVTVGGPAGWSCYGISHLDARNGIVVAVTSCVTTAPQPPRYFVWFNESGIPASDGNINWSVTLNGSTQPSGPFGTGVYVVFEVPNGSYPYSVSAGPSWNITPSSGSVTVAGVNQTVAVTFTVNGSYHPCQTNCSGGHLGAPQAPGGGSSATPFYETAAGIAALTVAAAAAAVLAVLLVRRLSSRPPSSPP